MVGVVTDHIFLVEASDLGRVGPLHEPRDLVAGVQNFDILQHVVRSVQRRRRRVSFVLLIKAVMSRHGSILAYETGERWLRTVLPGGGWSLETGERWFDQCSPAGGLMGGHCLVGSGQNRLSNRERLLDDEGACRLVD